MEEEQGSNSRELRAIYFVLADIKVAVEEILSYRGLDYWIEQVKAEREAEHAA